LAILHNLSFFLYNIPLKKRIFFPNMNSNILLVSFLVLCKAQESLAASETSGTSTTSPVYIYVAAACLALLLFGAAAVVAVKYFQPEKLTQTDIELDSERTSSLEFSSEVLKDHYPNIADACLMIDLDNLDTLADEKSSTMLSPLANDPRRVSVVEMERSLADERIIKFGHQRLMSCGYLDDTLQLEDDECEEFEFDGEGRGHRKQLSVVFAKEEVSNSTPRVSLLIDSPRVSILKFADKEDLVL